MGYGHPSEKKVYRKNFRTARKIFKSNTKNRPVKRALRRRGSINKRQTSAILTLGKQVKHLQQADRGDFQYQNQSTLLHMYAASQPEKIMPTTSGPVLFPFNCFYNKTVLFKGTLNTTTGTPGYMTIQDAAGNNSFQKQGVTTDMGGQYNWQIWNNTNTIAQNAYLPIYCRLRVRIGMNMKPSDLAQRFRITLFTCKNMPVPNNSHEYQLPDTLGAYRNLCCDDPNFRNHFSKSYHKVLCDRWVTFMPPSGASLATDKVIHQTIKTVTIPYAFPARLIQPRVKQFPLANDAFFECMPQNGIIWCLISGNQPDSSYAGGSAVPPTNPQPIPSITLSRYLSWRDKQGTTIGVGAGVGAGFTSAELANLNGDAERTSAAMSLF